MGAYPGKMPPRIDLGDELANYTDAEHAPPPRHPAPTEDVPHWDYMQGLKITAPLGPYPSWVITDPPHPNQMPIPPDAGAPPRWRDDDRCAQCQRFIPAPMFDNVVYAMHRFQNDGLCDECAWMRNPHR